MCGDGGVVRCPGCPLTDWSAFGWSYNAPASPGFLDGADVTLRRFFGERSAVMFRPGPCNCVWICGGGDFGLDLVGTRQPIGIPFPISSIAALQYRRIGTIGQWQLQLSRWYGYWDWTFENLERYGFGWGWDDDLSRFEDCGANPTSGAPYYGGYWGGYGGFGYNGWGWGWGGGYAYNVLYGTSGSLYSVTYSIAAGDVMNCHGGTTRFWLDTPPAGNFFDRDAWPQFVDVARVQR